MYNKSKLIIEYKRLFDITTSEYYWLESKGYIAEIEIDDFDTIFEVIHYIDNVIKEYRRNNKINQILL